MSSGYWRASPLLQIHGCPVPSHYSIRPVSGGLCHTPHSSNVLFLYVFMYCCPQVSDPALFGRDGGSSEVHSVITCEEGKLAWLSFKEFQYLYAGSDLVTIITMNYSLGVFNGISTTKIKMSNFLPKCTSICHVFA